MPASPSFASGTRNRWRKRKREPRRQQHKNNDDEDEEEDPTTANNHNNHNNANVNDDDNQLERDDDSEDPTQSQADPNSNGQHQEIEVLADGGFRISEFPLVIKRMVNRPHSSVMEIVALERANQSGVSKAQLQNGPFLENVSHGQLQASSSVPADSLCLDQDRVDGFNSGFVITPPPITEGHGVIKKLGNRVHVVPMHSDWFSPAAVHRLERQVVPHFFSGKSPHLTPEKYMECRNYIVARYMDNPGRRLTVSDFQGLFAGVDNEYLSRIVRFLDQWGIINYCADLPSHEPLNDESYLKEESSGEIRVPSAALRSIDSLIKFEKPKCRLKAAEVYSSLRSPNADISVLDDKIREHLSENYCNWCSRPLPVAYYQSQKEVDVLLCIDCFHDGRFVAGHSSIDFLRVDSTCDFGDADSDSWTDQETLLLLEAVEIYNENWNEIAEHVGTKSKAQCILHFLRLPMEDGKLENINVPSCSAAANLLNKVGRERLDPNLNGVHAELSHRSKNSEACSLPFTNSGNPVMALVAFLASSIGPRIAAVCAHAALLAISDDNPGSTSHMDELGHGNRLNSHGRECGPQGEIANSCHQNDDKAKVRGSRDQNEAEVTPLSPDKVKEAAKAGLAAAATKAKSFADHEEREIQRLSANIINHQLKRLELKLKQFAEIETLLMKECEQVERTRQRFAAERTRAITSRLNTGGATPPMNLPNVGPSMVNSTGNNRQQMMSASPSQPSISGYGNNQQVHPHMSFMPGPSMFGMGPRLPLSMIQQSSAAPSNIMFSASGGTQPTANHPTSRPVSGTNSGIG